MRLRPASEIGRSGTARVIAVFVVATTTAFAQDEAPSAGLRQEIDRLRRDIEARVAALLPVTPLSLAPQKRIV
jgi:hypothetical protein